MGDYSDNLFLYLDGLKNLVREVEGNENIHVGIRPYGFHAGNALVLVAYSYLLCEIYRKYHKKEPRFKFFISINDWEQDALDGPDYQRYPFNIYPKNTSIQHTFYRMQNGQECAITEYWQPIIEFAIRSKLKEFSFITLRFVRNSSLKSEKMFLEFLLKTINNPTDQLKILERYSGKEVLKEPLSYAGVICPGCHKAHGKTVVESDSGDVISWRCADCQEVACRRLQEFDFWWYHKPLLVARLKIFDIDITLSGGDHFNEGDYMIRKKLVEYFDPTIKIPKMLFTPTLLSYFDNERMSKSKNNHAFADLDALINFSRLCQDTEFVLPQEIVMDINDEQYKKYCCSL